VLAGAAVIASSGALGHAPGLRHLILAGMALFVASSTLIARSRSGRRVIGE
jgi:hypothetical protein